MSCFDRTPGRQTLAAWVLAPALALTLASADTHAQAVPPGASSLSISLVDWAVWGELGDSQNSQAFVDIGAGSTVLGFSWDQLVFTAMGESWREEVVISVNNAAGSAFLDAAPADGLASAGVFGPDSGAWGSNGLSFGSPFVSHDGALWLTLYDYYDNPDLDALLTSGTLTVFYAPVPEPASYGLLALGLGLIGLKGLATSARRRQSV